jgi:hypothetical protein
VYCVKISFSGPAQLVQSGSGSGLKLAMPSGLPVVKYFLKKLQNKSNGKYFKNSKQITELGTIFSKLADC